MAKSASGRSESVVQKTTELRDQLLLLWREVALLDDLDHLIKRTPPAPLACSPRQEGRTGSALSRPRHVIYQLRLAAHPQRGPLELKPFKVVFSADAGIHAALAQKRAP